MTRKKTTVTFCVRASLTLALLMLEPCMAAEELKDKKLPAKNTKEAASVSKTPDTELGAVTVTGEAVQDPNDPYNKSYTVTNSSIATKTDTPIMETPVSIQVVPRAVMNDQQAIQLRDVTKNVSGVQPGASDGNYNNAFIVRGFDLGNNTYRNGFRINSSQSETVNLERLEVLKGAAAMLYGRIEPGGLLNLVTKKPLDIPYYALQQQFGSYDLYRTTLDATGPVPGNDALLYRFNLAYQNNNSFRDFINSERIFIAPSLTWKATESTQFNVNMEYKHENSSDDYGLPAVGNRPAPIPISRNLGEPGTNQLADVWLVEFTGSHAFNDDWLLKGGVNANSTQYVWQDVANRGSGLSPDAQGNPNRILQRGVWFGPGNRYSQGTYLDLTGHFETLGAKHNVLVGGDYYSFDSDFSIFANKFSPVGCPIDIQNPTYGCVDFDKFRNLGKTAPDFNSRNEEQWGGIYFQDQITLWEKLHILGGGRYDWASTASGSSGTSLAAVELKEVHNERFSPRVGILYQPWKWMSLYGNYTESLGSANGLSATGQPFAPQTAEQYEAGIKLAWESLTASLAYYHLTKDNILATDANTGLNVPIGTQRSQGIEFDASGQVTDQLSLIATYAFTDARFTKANVGVEGNRAFNVPEHQASFWAKYDITRQFSVGTGVFMAGQREGNAANNFQLPGYARWDAMAAYKWDIGKSHLTAQVNVNNILDKEYYASTIGSRLRIQAAEPLSVLGSLKLEF
ncbi:MAG: TonB-dependent siderophore receptor [Methyloglobulus sp.]|nr:TonB-dependent siderophore receptor [Methyloglobulus sp.]